MLRTKALVSSGKHQGFALVELLVAMILGVIILYAVSELFVNNHRVRNELEMGSRQIENGRYAVQIMADDLSNAGYFGETGAQVFSLPLPPTCFDSDADIKSSLGVPVFGAFKVAVGGAPTCLGNFKVGNSYLSIRRASTCAAGVSDCEAFEDGQYHLQVSACQSESPGEVKWGTLPTELQWKARSCKAGEFAPRYRYFNHIYYVNDDDQLVRASLEADSVGALDYEATPLVDGIESINFEYGVDADGDGAPDEFKSGPTDAEWEDVVAVRVWVLTRNAQATAGYEDTNTYALGDLVIEGSTLPQGFKRQVYSSTVRLNNIAGRREAS